MPEKIQRSEEAQGETLTPVCGQGALPRLRAHIPGGAEGPTLGVARGVSAGLAGVPATQDRLLVGAIPEQVCQVDLVPSSHFPHWISVKGSSQAVPLESRAPGLHVLLKK